MTDWWGKVLGQPTRPAVSNPLTTPSRLPAKAVQWTEPARPQSTAPPTPVVQDPFANSEPGTALTGADVLNGRGQSYRGDPRKIQSMREDPEYERCPHCDGPNFFSRRTGVTRGHPPAPRCMDCGYNGSAMYSQETTPGSVGKASQSARQVSNPSSPAFAGGHVDFAHPVAKLT